jgi:hypothetical protein
MSLPGYVRDPARVQAALAVMPDKSVVAKQPLKIVVPSRFQEKQLATLGSDIYIVGIWAMIVDDKFYGISMTPAMMQIEPVATQTILMDGDEYLEFSFEKGSRVFVTTDLLKTKTLPYYIFDELLSRGNVPWYLEYEDLPHLFDQAPYHAGVSVGGNHAIFEMICAMIGRVKDDRRIHYRHAATSHDQQWKKPPAFVPFRSVIYNAPNTTAKLLGSYASDGLTSALVNPATRVERIEELLRR